MNLAFVNGIDLLILTILAFSILLGIVYAPNIYKIWLAYRKREQQRRKRQFDDLARSIREREAEDRPPQSKKRVVEKKKVTITFLNKKQNILCPLCRESADEGIRTCDGCQTGFHQACLDEMGNRCTTAGCRKSLMSEQTRSNLELYRRTSNLCNPGQTYRDQQASGFNQ